MKLFTEIDISPAGFSIGPRDRMVLLGSCFSDSIGAHLRDAGFEVCANPFGTLYNPASIGSAVRRLDSGEPFTEEDCVEMGAGAGRICSYEHHTSFARESAAEFLLNANARLEDAANFWQSSNRVIITLGTAYVWKTGGRVVSNCLKRPAAEFTRERLSVGECAELLRGILESHPDKEFILTVSPIRHLSGGAHSNTLSKSILHLGVEAALGVCGNSCYFPAYEILMDELRDYRFYDRDLVHPRDVAVDRIWEKFIAAFVREDDIAGLRAGEKASVRARHKPMLQ